MFKFGNPDYPGPYNAPVWPDLTVDIALAVLEDDKVPFDRSQRYLEANFKHHIGRSSKNTFIINGLIFK